MSFQIDIIGASEEWGGSYGDVKLNENDVAAIEEGNLWHATGEEALREDAAYDDTLEETIETAETEKMIMEGNEEIGLSSAAMAVASSNRIFAPIASASALRLTAANESIYDPKAVFVAAIEEKMGIVRKALETIGKFVGKLVRKMKSVFGKLVTAVGSKEKALIVLKKKVDKLGAPKQLTEDKLKSVGELFPMLVDGNNKVTTGCVDIAQEIVDTAALPVKFKAPTDPKASLKDLAAKVGKFGAKVMTFGFAFSGNETEASALDSKTFKDGVVDRRASIFGAKFTDKATVEVVSTTLSHIRIIVSEVIDEKFRIKYTVIPSKMEDNTEYAEGALNVGKLSALVDSTIKVSKTIKKGFDESNTYGNDIQKLIDSSIKEMRKPEADYDQDAKNALTMLKTQASVGYGMAMDRYKITGQILTLGEKLVG
jgi:hypothetical protein